MLFFFTVNQMCGGSSQLPTTAERAVIKSLTTVQTMKQCSAVVGDWEAEQLIFIERRSRHNTPKMAKYGTRNVEINNLIDKIRKKFRVNLSGCVISDIVLLRWLNRVMQGHEARASDLNRKLIFSFFLLFS